MIVSINLTEANAAWAKAFNNSMEKALRIKIGLTQIMNLLVYKARSQEEIVRRAIIEEKHAAAKRKAMNEYHKKMLHISGKKEK